MAKRRRDPSPIGTTPTEAAETAYNTVFIDTSLDTHLAMLVSYCDTVSDFKEKITMEHIKCFPKFGKIKIQSLKVRRRGNFYHLPDFMLVRSAFEGIKRNWFLSAETSSLKEFNDNNISSAPDGKGNLLSIEYPRGDGQSILLDDSPKILPPIRESKSQNIPTADGHSSDMYSDANRISALKMLLSDGNDEANVVSEMTFGLKVDDKTGDNSAEQSLRTVSPPKKKHKRRHGKDGSHGPTFELERSGFLASTKDTISRSEISGSGNSLVGMPESEDAQQRKHILLEVTAALSGVQTDQFQNEVGDVFDKILQLESAAVKEYKVGSNQSTENHLDSGNRKEDSMLESVINVPENSMAEKHEMLGSDVATVQLEGNASGPSLSTEKRKKKRRGNHTENYTHHPLHKSAPAVNHEETDQTDMEENQKEFSLNHDPEVMQSMKLGPKDHGGNITESARLDKQSDACGERGHDSGRKRRSKKSSAKILQETDVKHSNNVTCADEPNLEFNNAKNESILTPSETCQTTEIDARNLIANHELIKVPCVADVTVKEPNLSAKLLDANGAIEAANFSGIKRKKKKKKRSTRKSSAKIQDSSVIEHSTEKSESVENYTRTLWCKSNEQESGLSINNDPEAIQPSNSNSLFCDKPDITLKETISTEQLLDTKTVVEPGSSGGSRKKKRVKKSDPLYLEPSGMEHTTKEGVNGTSSDEKRQWISFNKGKDLIKKKSLEGSAEYTFEEVDNANGNEENLLPLAQTGRTNQSTEITGEKITKIEGGNLNPADSCYRDLPLDEQEKQVKSSQLDQVHKNQESTGHMDKREKEEIEKKQLTASKDHESSPIKYHEVGAEDLTASNDKLGMTCNLLESAKVKLNIASPSTQLAVSEMEVGKEKLKGMPETDLRTDNLVNNFENEDEGINFKSYFIPSQQQDKVASSGGVKVSTKSNQKRKAEKNKKKHDSPSVSATLNVQNSVKSYENQECENTSVIRHEKLPSNHDHSEVMLNTKKSLKVSENLEKASSQTDVAGTGTLQKPEETPSAYDSEAIRAAAARSEENNKSLAGSSSKRSTTFTENGRDKSRQSDVANQITSSKNAGIVLNSSQPKKSLLAKSGTVFWDNVSESSGDENGTINSNSSTCTPSDSSSSSGNSEGESELSQKSTRNGSNCAKKTFAGGKNILKSDLSGQKNITMDMLLRSSASFKKAKHIATQQVLEDAESQPVDFVPDSQVNT
ncbi:unnamed protein product [Fraxinus pennsylvanica]|uniref:Uncharacterized protein n=1 Tax=Fraxinus pennsylvanica TaxID=56036 RepID=A0AAD1ZTH8_9LAMI|nr:unnamed protein product [Fraxinus pennsylvanica]